jgi:CRP-like cAMP-binding protein
MAKPNDVLYQPADRERIYIVRSGKVDVYAEKAGSKRGMKNPLKSIKNSLSKDISDNCYGYSAVLSARSTKLYAISKEFSSCYYVEKSAFL